MILYVYVLHQVSRLSKFQDCCCKYLQGIRDKQLSLSGTLIRSTQCHRASSLLFWIRMECGSQTKPIPFHLGASLHSKTGVSPKCKGCRRLQDVAGTRMLCPLEGQIFRKCMEMYCESRMAF